MNLIRRAMLFSILTVFQAFSQTTPTAPATPAAPVAPTAQTPSPYLRQATVSEAAGMVHITANSPRPLAQVLDALQVKYKWIVSYEDPQFTSEQDVVTVTRAGDTHMQLPSGGSFSVDFSAAAPDEEKTLRSMVDSYNHSKNPGRFEVKKTREGSFYLVGTAATDDKGHISPQQVAFDVPITIPAEERSITETLNLICQEISNRTHMPVTVGVSPRSLLDHTNVKLGGNAVAARDLLVQSLAGVRTHPYWRLLFDPSSKGYYLDIHSPHVQ